MKSTAQRHGQGLPFRMLNYIMAGTTLIISVLLLITTFRTMNGYNELHEVTVNYIEWEKHANDMQQSSDYLTEQVRSFAETGDRIYLDNYFEEAKVLRRRDKALEFIKEIFGDSETYRTLSDAMSESVDLMNREYYSMRLKIESLGQDIDDYPEEIGNVVLSGEDSALTAQEKSAMARQIVFDDVYHQKKDYISKYTTMCLSKLIDEIEARQNGASVRLSRLLNNERMLIILLISIVLIVVIITTAQIIRPLVRAIPQIRNDQPISVRGASEFRFLAETYNQMYETNRERKEQLAFAATHDPLTKTYNRSGFDMLMKTLSFRRVALILIDVDYFKRVNDENGHGIGDQILVKVSSTVRDRFRSDDCLCRIGGDEFALFMRNADPDHKKSISDKIKSINDSLSAPDDGLPPVSISVGVAFGDRRGAGDIFAKADKALYVTKENGRCGCTFYDENNDRN